MSPEILYAAMVTGGFLAGFIDAIAGGGGLITLPLLMMAVGNPVGAIASNKIVGTTGAVCALWIYRRAGHLDWRKGVRFTAWVVVGSLAGSSLTPWIPTQVLRWAVVVICPLILWLVWKKDSWVVEILPPGPPRRARKPGLLLASVGLACGFYDGAFGPGGGTFMFLALLGIVKLPLLAAMAVTKLSNSFSAGTALLRFGVSGHVDWKMGGIVACGMAVGSVFGARYASAQAARAVKPVLTFVVLLLVLKMIME